jgi:Spy/CpxP family protein refolding chaperone
MRTLCSVSITTGLLAAAVLTSAMSSTAPEAVPDRDQQAFRHERMAIVARRLGLTADQETKLKDLRAQTAAAVKAIQANSAFTPDQRQAQVRATRQASRDQMRAVLTADQQARFAEIISHPRRLNAAAVRHVRMDALARRLGLTTEQRTQIRAIQQRTAATVRSIRKDSALSAEPRHARVRAIVQTGRKEMRGVLTPDQRTKLDQMRRRLRDRLGPLG